LGLFYLPPCINPDTGNGGVAGAGPPPGGGLRKNAKPACGRRGLEAGGDFPPLYCFQDWCDFFGEEGGVIAPKDGRR
jgi:hypothetical protein